MFCGFIEIASISLSSSGRKGVGCEGRCAMKSVAQPLSSEDMSSGHEQSTVAFAGLIRMPLELIEWCCFALMIEADIHTLSRHVQFFHFLWPYRLIMCE